MYTWKFDIINQFSVELKHIKKKYQMHKYQVLRSTFPYTPSVSIPMVTTILISVSNG